METYHLSLSVQTRCKFKDLYIGLKTVFPKMIVLPPSLEMPKFTPHPPFSALFLPLLHFTETICFRSSSDFQKVRLQLQLVASGRHSWASLNQNLTALNVNH